MVRQGQGGRSRASFSQTTLMRGAFTSTNNNSTPNPCKPSHKRSVSPSSTSPRSQRRSLLSTFPSAVPITLIPLKDQLSQYDLHGHNQQAVDNHIFRDAYPTSPSPNSSLFTFQNIGPQKQSASHSASKLNSSRFSLRKASVSFFADHCLNETKLPHCDTFNARMKVKSPTSFSYLLKNKHEATSSSWHLVGGIGFTMCSLLRSHKLNHGGDSTGLGRWSFARFQG